MTQPLSLGPHYRWLLVGFEYGILNRFSDVYHGNISVERSGIGPKILRARNNVSPVTLLYYYRLDRPARRPSP